MKLLEGKSICGNFWSVLSIAFAPSTEDLLLDRGFGLIKLRES